MTTASSTTDQSSTAVMTGYIDRTTRLLKQWSKRYFTFDPSSRKLTYAKDEKSAPKGTILVTKIIRMSEQFEFKATDPDLLSMSIDGTLDNGQAEQWSVRFPDLAMFSLWYSNISKAACASGLMEATDCGLPTVDPRYNIPFATLPLEHLQKFGLLEKAIMYFFGPCGTHSSSSGVGAAAHVGASLLSGGSTNLDSFLVVSDKNVYLFRPSAEVLRCFLVSSVTKIHHTPGTNFMCMQLEAPEADVVLKNTAKTKDITEIVRRIYKVNSQGKEIPVVPITATTVESFVESAGLRLVADADFKQTIVGPTPKSRLKFALDMYEKKNGSKFGLPSSGGSGGGSGAGAQSASPLGSLSSSPAGDAGKSQRKKRDESDSRSPNGPPAPSASALQALGGKETDMNIPIVRMLHRLNLQQYVVCLLSQHVDLDVLQCMDDSDLESFGVRSSAHRQLIISAAANNGEPTPSPSRSKADSVSLDSSPVVSSVAPASPAKRPEIVLSDDEDDLLVAVAAPAKAPLILLDDSDDDLLPPVLAAVPASPGQAPFRKPINLDEDEDDDI